MNTLDDLLKFAERHFAGSFTVLKYRNCWKVMFGIPSHDAITTVLPEFDTLQEAAKFSIDNHLDALVIESIWDFASESIIDGKDVNWDTILLDVAKHKNMSIKDYMITYYPNREEED